ncbi:MAG: hypothetical protein PHD02_00050 [Bacilli bacterium]|nr:hypothetical protein [Bacilli bacterium]
MEKYEKLAISDLVLWKDNARYSKTLDSEEDCLKELFGNKTMNQKQKVLLNDLFLESKIIENCIIYKEEINENEFQYIVLDGNRRISLFKVLNYPDLVKKYGLDFVKLNSINEKIRTVDCKIYDDINEAYKHVELRHLDEQNGKGTVKWASENKDRMLIIQGKEVDSIGYKIMKFYESTNKPEFSEVKAKIKDKSTLDRIFGFKNVFNGIFGLKSKYDYDLYNPEHQIKINDILKKFYSSGGKVNLVYTADSTKKLLEDVESLPIDSNQMSLDIANKDNDDSKNFVPEVNDSKNNFSTKKHNKYTIKGVILFDWRSRGIDSNNDLLNYYLKELVDIEKLSDFDQAFILDIAPYFYRLLLDISISDLTSHILGGSADRFLVPSFNKEPFNTTSSSVSCVNHNKISSIISIYDNLRKNEDKKTFEEYKKELKKYNFTSKNETAVTKFVQDLNDVIHGSSKTLSPETIAKYDKITIILIQSIYHFIKLK